MARPLRIEFGGAVYHVLARGNHGRTICADDKDRQMWVATLAQAWQRTGWKIHAWVLMGNHYHLLLETPEPNLVRGMKWLQGTYTQRFNARHHKRGHLFQGRYRAVPVDASSGQYFQTVSTYTHLNPARAKLIRVGRDKLWQYPWSSYPAYARRTRTVPEWLVTERVLGSLRLGPQAWRGYEACLESRVLELGIRAGRQELEAEWRALRRGWYFGSEQFRDCLPDGAEVALKGKRCGSLSRAERRPHDERQAEKMLEAGLKLMKLRPRELATLPKGQLEKQVLAWWVYGNTTVRRRWLAERLAMGCETRISQAASYVEGSQSPGVLGLKSTLLRYEK